MKSPAIRAIFLGIILLLLTGQAIAQSALQPFSLSQFNLPSQSYVSNYYIDVDSTAKDLDIVATASTSDTDIDLFVRYGTPFPVTGNANYPTSPQQVSEDTLTRWSHYHAISSSFVETISIQPSSHVPLKAGRWYIAVINAQGPAATVTLDAMPYTAVSPVPINIDFNNPGTGANDVCNVAPWTDATAVSPVGGNPGTTLGAQRQNALKYAVQQITQ
ncbi:MAG TPA: hypothetical protein VN720_08455, partial [Rudaea sp.]|nr:hypothetical protein [Rudaea sp.]